MRALIARKGLLCYSFKGIREASAMSVCVTYKC